MKTTLRELLNKELEKNNDSLDNLIHSTIYTELLDVEFEEDRDSLYRDPVNIWTKDFIYFTVHQDGYSLWFRSISREPTKTAVQIS